MSNEIATPDIANPIVFFSNPIDGKIKPKSQNSRTTRNNNPTQGTDDKNNTNDVPNSTARVINEIMNLIVPILFF